MIERHVANDFIDPLVTSIIRDDNLWELVESGIRPIVRDCILPRAEEFAKNEEIPAEIYKLLGDSGFYGMSIPKEYDGLGYGTLGDCLVIFETGYGDMSTSLLPLVTTSLFGRAVQIGGTEEQKERILPKIASGELYGCYALTESGGSSFAESIRTRARKKGGRYVISGEKLFITNADYANLGVVFARIEGTENGIGAFLVPNKDRLPEGYDNGNGYRVTGKLKGKPGLLASATCTISMDSAEVPEEDVLGLDFQGGKGHGVAVKTLGLSRPTIAAQALGNAKRALSYVMQYAAETPRGDGKINLLDLPLYRADLAMLTGKLIQNVSYLFGAAVSMDRGDIAKSDPLKVYSSMLKAIATDEASEICRKAMGMLGGAGYSGEHPLGRIWRDSGVPPIYEGHNTLQLHHSGKFISRHLKNLCQE